MPNTLENLKKEAKRWLKALRANDVHAQERLRNAYPDAPAEPTLRDLQYALARERAQSWIALTQKPHELISRFIHYACWDHHAHGHATHDMQQQAPRIYFGCIPILRGMTFTLQSYAAASMK